MNLKLSEVLKLGLNSRTYFIADIAANHDGDLNRAIKLIELAAKSGANAAKFQNFRAETIVSSRGFAELGQKISHQAKWEKDVVDVYKDAELPVEWTDRLREACKKFNIEYFTAPYDLELIDYFATKMDYFKVGSGDITWRESLESMAATKLPIIVATGASNISEVEQAVRIVNSKNKNYVLMQCNTNYTGDLGNLNFLNLNVITQYSNLFPDAVLGLSDHSHGFVSVLGAVALGARVIEKHFTDDTERIGPDHGFSLNPDAWAEMVRLTRDLENCLGDGKKKVEENEIEARIVQRRGLRFSKNLEAGSQIRKSDVMALRPCPEDAISPFEIDKVLGRKIRQDVEFDQQIRWELLL